MNGLKRKIALLISITMIFNALIVSGSNHNLSLTILDNLINDDEITSGETIQIEDEISTKAAVDNTSNMLTTNTQEITLLSDATEYADLTVLESKTLNEDVTCNNLVLNNSSATLDLNGYTLTVMNNFLHKEGTLKVNGGTLIIYGDYCANRSTALKSNCGRCNLIMQNSDDYVLVYGNMDFDPHNKNTSLTDGILEIKGDFNQKRTYAACNTAGFKCSGNHKVILSGTGTQNISFVSYPYSSFNKVYLTQSIENYNFSPSTVWNEIIYNTDDNTKPDTPENITISLENTGVSLSWDNVSASDLLYYNVYRNNEFLSRAYNNSYVDNSITESNTYEYYITAVDTVGNESEISEKISVTINLPEIYSISPPAGSDLKTEQNFSVLFNNISNIDTSTLYYGHKDSNSWQSIANGTKDENSPIIRFSWNAENVEDTEFDLKVEVTDVLGHNFSKVYENYTLQNSIPQQAELSVTSGIYLANLSWTDENENTATYKIYRKDSESEDFNFISATNETSYTDVNLSENTTYYYKVVIVNTYGNSCASNIVSVIPNNIDTIAPVSNAGVDVTGVVGDEIAFIGTNSTDNVGITSYHWDFGDGTTSDEINPVHSYSSVKSDDDYDYTVQLTVSDEAGNSNTSSIKATIYPQDQTGILTVKVKEKGGNVIPNAYVYADFSDSPKLCYTLMPTVK
jgi:fibronectin type 3 domain-containing protein